MGRLGQSRRRRLGGMEQKAEKIGHYRITQGNIEKTIKSAHKRGSKGGDRREECCREAKKP